ncbi:MAG: ankyrin repeat domain-containing protein [bacterium]
MNQRVIHARSMRPAFIALVLLALLAPAMLAGCGDSGGSLEQMKIPNTPAGFIEEAAKGNLEAVRLFVEGGMKVTGADSPGQKAFAAAVRGKRRGVLAYLRQAGVVTPAEAELRKNEVPYSVEEFLKRAGAGDVETVKLFLAAGMNPSALAVNGRSALGMAEKSQQSDMMAVLKAAGATLNPFEGLKKLGLKLDRKTFLTVVQKGNLEAVKYFVEAGMALDTKDRLGLTPLAWAVHANQLEMAKLLINKGASLNSQIIIQGGRIQSRRNNQRIKYVKTTYINAALLEAVLHGREQAVQYLIDKGARPDGLGLIVAAYTGTPRIVKALLKSMSEINKSDRANAYRVAKVGGKMSIANALAGGVPEKKMFSIWLSSDFYTTAWALQKLAEDFARSHPNITNLRRDFIGR